MSLVIVSFFFILQGLQYNNLSQNSTIQWKMKEKLNYFKRFLNCLQVNPFSSIKQVPNDKMIFWAGFSGWNLLLLKMWWKVNVQLFFKSILKGKLGYICFLWTFPFWNKYKQKVTKEAFWIKHLGSLCFNFSNKSMVTNASTISHEMSCIYSSDRQVWCPQTFGTFYKLRD